MKIIKDLAKSKSSKEKPKFKVNSSTKKTRMKILMIKLPPSNSAPTKKMKKEKFMIYTKMKEEHLPDAEKKYFNFSIKDGQFVI